VGRVREAHAVSHWLGQCNVPIDMNHDTRLTAANSKAQGNALGMQTDLYPNQGPTGRNSN
jgi:hypothetical protein